MNTLLCSLFLTFLFNLADLDDPIQQAGRRDRPTKLVHFEVGTHMSADGTKLRLNVDKQLGGLVYIQLLNRQGILYFNKTLYADEALIRLSLDLSHLTDNYYTLKISNGLDMVTRELKVTTVRPVEQTRVVTLQ